MLINVLKTDMQLCFFLACIVYIISHNTHQLKIKLTKNRLFYTVHVFEYHQF